MTEKPRLRVVGAAILKENKLLCAQRGDKSKSLAGFWEFPGGKVDNGENEIDALVREVREECLCDIKVGEHIVTSEHEYDFAIINLSTYYCTLANNNNEPQLTEHSQFVWIPPTEIMSLKWAPADIEAVRLIYSKLG